MGELSTSFAHRALLSIHKPLGFTMKIAFSRSLLLVGISAMTISAIAQTNMYRWVDKDGKVHFSDQPPPQTEKNVQQKRIQGNVIEVDKMPFATRDAMKKNPVVLYTAANCDACKEGRTLLTTRGIPFTEKVVDKDQKLLDELKKTAGETSVPMLMIGNNPIKGYETVQWQSALDTAGYPRVNANFSEVKPVVIEKADATPAKGDAKADAAKNADR
jgi:glutaredoxin